MKSYWLILRYFYSGLRPVMWLGIACVCLLPVILLVTFLQKNTMPLLPWIAIGIGTLVIPYLVAPPQLQRLLGNRRLALVPLLPLRAGLCMLVLAMAAAWYLPLSIWALGKGNMRPLLMLHLFNVATLYAAIMYVTLTSRHALAMMTVVPIGVVVSMEWLSEWLRSSGLMYPFTLSLYAMCVAGWLLALWHLARRSHFKPVSTAYYRSRYGFDFSHLPLPQLPVHSLPAPASASTLLLSYPGTWRARVYNLGAALVVSPVIYSIVPVLVTLDNRQPTTLSFLNIVLLLNLLLTQTYPWTFGELAARLRLLWLRQDGDRQGLWHVLETQMWCSYLVMGGFTVSLFALSQWLDPLPFDHAFTLCLLALIMSLHNGYVNVLMRLRHSTPLGQGLVMVLIGLGGTAVIAVAYLMPLPALLPVSGLVLAALALLYRSLAMRAVLGVDWQLVRPTIKGQAGA